MAKIIIPTPFRKFTNNKSVIETKAKTVGEAIQELITSFKGLEEYLFDPNGNFRSFIRIFIGNEDINELQRKSTVIGHSTVISIIPAIAGG